MDGSKEEASLLALHESFLSSNLEEQEVLINSGLLEEIEGAMQSHPSSISIQGRSLQLLSHLIQSSNQIGQAHRQSVLELEILDLLYITLNNQQTLISLAVLLRNQSNHS
jgi:hypothetical protein